MKGQKKDNQVKENLQKKRYIQKRPKRGTKGKQNFKKENKK